MKTFRPIVASLLILAGCPSNTPAPPAEVWAPTTTPFDPGCGQCKEIGAGSLSHIGEGKVLIDTKTDDPPAQWGRCIMSFMKCVDADGGIPGCLEGARCPDACKAEFKKQLGTSTGFDAEVAAMDKTFFDEGARCNAPGEPEVSP